tara:strand:+ start:11907 stop:12272 length:366 start_codon:yes stop_codon:yes gene_type:complete
MPDHLKEVGINLSRHLGVFVYGLGIIKLRNHLLLLSHLLRVVFSTSGWLTTIRESLKNKRVEIQMLSMLLRNQFSSCLAKKPESPGTEMKLLFGYLVLLLFWLLWKSTSHIGRVVLGKLLL